MNQECRVRSLPGLGNPILPIKKKRVRLLQGDCLLNDLEEVGSSIWTIGLLLHQFFLADFLLLSQLYGIENLLFQGAVRTLVLERIKNLGSRRMQNRCVTREFSMHSRKDPRVLTEEVCKKKLAEEEARAQRKELLAQAPVTTVLEGFKESLDTFILLSKIYMDPNARDRGIGCSFFFLSLPQEFNVHGIIAYVISMCFCFGQF